MGSQAEVANWVNRNTIEAAYKECIEAQQRRDYEFAMRGMRAVRARDTRVMIVLEKAATILSNIADEQGGEYRARRDIPDSHKVYPTEVQLWREAYKMADKGEPLENFMWIYGAATRIGIG